MNGDDTIVSGTISAVTLPDEPPRDDLGTLLNMFMVDAKVTQPAEEIDAKKFNVKLSNFYNKIISYLTTKFMGVSRASIYFSGQDDNGPFLRLMYGTGITKKDDETVDDLFKLGAPLGNVFHISSDDYILTRAVRESDVITTERDIDKIINCDAPDRKYAQHFTGERRAPYEATAIIPFSIGSDSFDYLGVIQLMSGQKDGLYKLDLRALLEFQQALTQFLKTHPHLIPNIGNRSDDQGGITPYF